MRDLHSLDFLSILERIYLYLPFKAHTTNKQTEKIWNGSRSKKLPNEIQNVARRKLRMLNNAQEVDDLRIPPANRLEKLKGDLKDFYSIRINNQWRIIFQWKNNDAYDAEIVDYH